METDRNGLEVLGREECLALLTRASLGRVAVTTAALPTILPVNFRLCDDQILFGTAQGSKLDAATQQTVVAFEVDDIEPFGHTGWSVVVTGIARAASVGSDLAALDQTSVPRWAPAGDTRLVAISTDLVTGRRLWQCSHLPVS